MKEEDPQNREIEENTSSKSFVDLSGRRTSEPHFAEYSDETAFGGISVRREFYSFGENAFATRQGRGGKGIDKGPKGKEKNDGEHSSRESKRGSVGREGRGS